MGEKAIGLIFLKKAKTVKLWSKRLQLVKISLHTKFHKDIFNRTRDMDVFAKTPDIDVSACESFKSDV